MFSLLLIVGAVVILLFGFVLLFGAPYLPTLSAQANDALDLLDLKPGGTMLELGCGDGRVLNAAAGRGLNAVGYELNPIMFAIAWANTRRNRGSVRVVLGNFWSKDWPECSGVYVFLLQKYMSKLDKKLIQHAKSNPGLKLVSFTFTVPGKKEVSARRGVKMYQY